MNWPPPFTLQLNKRAKHIRLKICPRKGLQIVIPHARAKKDALLFLQKKRTWVEKYLKQLNLDTENLALDEQKNEANRESLPKIIELPSLQEVWQVKYQKTIEKQKPQLIVVAQHLMLFGDVDDYKTCKELLENWLKVYAKKNLVARLKELAQQNNFQINQIKIRAQQTRWGSCSASKDIHLNYKLLLLPKPLVEYVLIHELCHTVHLNHSKKFWQLVGTFVKNYQNIRKELRQCNNLLPSWIYYD